MIKSTVAEKEISQLPIRLDNPLLANEIVFLVTTQCNIECTYCYNFYTQKHIQMPPEMAVGFLKQYLDYHQLNGSYNQLFQLIFTGGEPTINPDAIFAVMDYVNSIGLTCVPTLLTNGILSQHLLDRLIEEKFLFQLSYDGGGNVLRRSRSNKTMNSYITDAFEQIAKAGQPIVLRATITRHNVTNMTEVIAFAKEHKVSAVIFDTCDELGNALKYEIQRANIDDYLSSYFAAMAFAKECNVDILVPEINRLKKNGEYQQLPKLVLLPDGTLTTTTKYLSRTAKDVEKGIIGEYSLEKGIQLDQAKINNMVNNFLTNLNKHCIHCECFTYCRGRNQNIQLFRESIVTQKDDYRCDITKGIYRKLKTDNYTNN
jgi:sulfatase maturation enzyme AslB (radical SAM superfamily)